MAEKTDVAKNATTTDTVGKTSNPRLKDGSEVVTTSALLAKPLVKTTDAIGKICVPRYRKEPCADIL